MEKLKNLLSSHRDKEEEPVSHGTVAGEGSHLASAGNNTTTATGATQPGNTTGLTGDHTAKSSTLSGTEIPHRPHEASGLTGATGTSGTTGTSGLTGASDTTGTSGTTGTTGTTGLTGTSGTSGTTGLTGANQLRPDAPAEQSSYASIKSGIEGHPPTSTASQGTAAAPTSGSTAQSAAERAFPLSGGVAGSSSHEPSTAVGSGIHEPAAASTLGGTNTTSSTGAPHDGREGLATAAAAATEPHSHGGHGHTFQRDPCETDEKPPSTGLLHTHGPHATETANLLDPKVDVDTSAIPGSYPSAEGSSHHSHAPAVGAGAGAAALGGAALAGHEAHRDRDPLTSQTGTAAGTGTAAAPTSGTGLGANTGSTNPLTSDRGLEQTTGASSHAAPTGFASALGTGEGLHHEEVKRAETLPQSSTEPHTHTQGGPIGLQSSREPHHDHGKEAAGVGAGAAALGAGAAAHHHHEGQQEGAAPYSGPASSTIGPHKSNVLNVLDPRVQPDPTLQRPHDATTGATTAGSTTTGQSTDPQHHYGRDAAVAGGVGAAGLGAHEHNKHAHEGSHVPASTTSTSTTEPHSEKHGLLGLGHKKDHDTTTGHHDGHHKEEAALGGTGAAVAAHEHGKHSHHDPTSSTTAPAVGGAVSEPSTHHHHDKHPETTTGHSHHKEEAALGGTGAAVAAHEHGKHSHEHPSTTTHTSTDPTHDEHKKGGLLGIFSHKDKDQSVPHEEKHHHDKHRDEALVGGAGATGLAAHEHNKHTHEHPTGTQATTATRDPTLAQHDKDHHYGRDAALAGGAGATGLAAHEHGKHAHEHPTGSQATTTTHDPTRSTHDKDHHLGRDAAVAGGAGGLAAHEHGKHAHGQALGTQSSGTTDPTTAEIRAPHDPLSKFEARHREKKEAELAGGAGAAGLAAHEHGKHAHEHPTSHQATAVDPHHTSSTTDPLAQQKDHHYGRDAALAGGAGGLAAHEHGKHAHDESTATGTHEEPKKHGILGKIFGHKDKDTTEHHDKHHDKAVVAEEAKHHHHDKHAAPVAAGETVGHRDQTAAPLTSQEPTTHDSHLGRDAALGAGAVGAGAYGADKVHSHHKNDSVLDPQVGNLNERSAPIGTTQGINDPSTTHGQLPLTGDSTQPIGTETAGTGTGIGSHHTGTTAAAAAPIAAATHSDSTGYAPTNTSNQAAPISSHTQQKESHGLWSKPQDDPLAQAVKRGDITAKEAYYNHPDSSVAGTGSIIDSGRQRNKLHKDPPAGYFDKDNNPINTPGVVGTEGLTGSQHTGTGVGSGVQSGIVGSGLESGVKEPHAGLPSTTTGTHHGLGHESATTGTTGTTSGLNEPSLSTGVGQSHSGLGTGNTTSTNTDTPY